MYCCCPYNGCHSYVQCLAKVFIPLGVLPILLHYNLYVRVESIGGREVRRRRIQLNVTELFNNNKLTIPPTLNVTIKQSAYNDPSRTNTKH